MDEMATIKNNVPQILRDRKMTISDLMRESRLSYPSAFKMAKLETIPDTMNMGTIRKTAEGLGLRVNDIIQEVGE